jgi:multidrug efflux pump subunit AcrB
MHSLIAWFARNSVAANLLMIFIVVWGLTTLATRLPLEVFPSFESDTVIIPVPFRGASPAEVEEGVTIKIEEEIQDIIGIKRITSTAREGVGTVYVEVAKGYDTDKVQNEVDQRLGRIRNFPEDVDTPTAQVPQHNREVISVVIAGALPEKELRFLAASLRDDLEALPNVSSVQLSGAREFELSIEVSEKTLSRYDLTLADVARAINNSSLDLAAGSIRTTAGEVLLRTKGQAYGSADFRDVVVVSKPDGTRVTVGDIATVRDGFEEKELVQAYNGQRSIEIDVFRSGLQSAITVADEVKNYLVEAQASMPYGVTLGYWRDRSRIVKARLNTLLSSAVQGGLLILVLLTLFLRFWVAMWVFIGVPVAILGGIVMMPLLGVTVNLISLFAFILVLGIVVDDAIVTGENIYTHMRRNPDGVQAAIDGTQEVAVPVTFGVLTTVAAFLPLLMIDGVRGQIFAQIPLIIIPVLLFSIVESKFVLPAHLSHLNFHKKTQPNVFARMQYRIADGFEWSIAYLYQPVLAVALRNRYLVLSIFIGVAILIFSLVGSGNVRFVFFPRVQSEIARASLEMPDGTPFAVTQRHIDRMTAAVQQLRDKYVDPATNEPVIEGIMSTAGSAGGSSKGSHLGRVMFEIVPPEERTLEVTSAQLVNEWRRAIGEIPGAKNVSYRAEIGRGGSPIDVQLSGFDFDELRDVAGLVENELRQYSGVSDISNTFEGGKQEIELSIKPSAAQLGITVSMLAQQVREAYLGTEVQNIQRNRDDVKVIVRYPDAERRSINSLQRLSIRTGNGKQVPLSAVADVQMGRGFSVIKRVDRRRTVNVQADLNKEVANVEGIKTGLLAFGETIRDTYPNIRISLEGEAREQRESFASLRLGLWFVLLIIYTLLAIPFRSYLQPLLVMLVIPFGVVGGILGHMIMGMSLSIMSYMGMLALCGVVVNDSLVLVDYVNRRRREGVAVLDAVRTAGVARFRAVILTSLTTFFGLIPLIFETSTQAQFLIPMAVSLGFGILFATVVTLLLIPVNYLVLEDIRRLTGHSTRREQQPGIAG